ncbi:MAG: hypothetical protein RI967_1353 [Planctomycetota bacterium]
MPSFTARPARPSALLLAVTILGGAVAADADAAIRFVNAGLTTGANDGSSWENAYRGVGGLATALAASVSGDEIWVVKGTYRPTTGTSRTVAFTLKSGVGIYGGFAGSERKREQRDPDANLTTLSGDLLGNDSGTANLTDNSYHVVVGSGASATAILDGFTIRAGNANGATASNLDKGGGLIILNSGSPTIRRCTFTANRCTFGGGAVYIFTAGASFADCRFLSNVGGSFGGAFDMNNVVAGFDRCWFEGNTAARAGACESFGGSQTRYTNCVFTANTATGTNGGGALWIGTSSAVTARNSTFVGNSATQLAGGVRNTGGSSTFSNCILWANTGPGGTTSANQISNGGGTTSVSYSTVQGGYTGSGNLSTDPKFADQAGRDFHLDAGSPAIDSGANATVTTGTTTDFDGAPRFVDDPTVADTGAGTAPIVDRGAFERQASACPSDLDGNGVVNAADLSLLLGSWGTAGVGDLDGNGTVNAADLALLLGAWGGC